MDYRLKQIISYIFIFIVLIVTILSILSIWEVISLDRILWKTTKSLGVIFISSIVILFVFSLLNNKPPRKD